MDNAASADRAWDRLAKRGWKCTLSGPYEGKLPWRFIAAKIDPTDGKTIASYEKGGTTRVEAVLLGAKAVNGD